MSRNLLIALTIVIILIILGAIFFGQKSSPSLEVDKELFVSPVVSISASPTASISATISPVDNTKTSTGSALGAENVNELKIEDLKVGTGADAKTGTSVTVNYKGTLTNGTQFDSSYDRGDPFTFDLGAGDVIKGWDQGVAGMKVGGKRKLTIPSDLAYGSRALPGIPANSTLIFEVELLKVE